MRKLDGCDVEEFGRLDSSEKTIAILGDRWWPQTAKQDGDRISKQFLCSIWKKRNERPNVGGVSARSRNGAPSRKGRVVNGQMTKAATNESPPFPPACNINQTLYLRSRGMGGTWVHSTSPLDVLDVMIAPFPMRVVSPPPRCAHVTPTTTSSLCLRPITV